MPPAAREASLLPSETLIGAVKDVRRAVEDLEATLLRGEYRSLHVMLGEALHTMSEQQGVDQETKDRTAAHGLSWMDDLCADSLSRPVADHAWIANALGLLFPEHAPARPPSTRT